MIATRLAAIVIAAAALAVGAAGCTTGVAGEAMVDAAAAEPATAPEPPEHSLDEQIYLDTLDAEGIYYSTAQQAIDTAEAVCSYLDAGGTLHTAIQRAIRDGGYGPYDAGYLVGAATAAFCPEHGEGGDVQ